MRYLILLLIFVGGCAPITYTPIDFGGGSGMYYTDLGLKTQCSVCKEYPPLYKIDSKDRVICNDCYRKIKK